MPPAAGNLPKKGKILLADVYTGCRSKGGIKRICAAVAWKQVKASGFKHVGEKWKKI